MNKPNFLIVGAAKAGTTALYHYLQQHPDVFMTAKKETNYFALVGTKHDYFEYGQIPAGEGGVIDTTEKYAALFAGANGYAAIGEASPWYLFDADVPARIRDFSPDMKIIVILRNPADRAYSEFVHYIRDGTEPYPLEDFLKAFDEGDWRSANGWHPHWNYAQKGFYARHLSRYFELFPREQIKIYLYEDLAKNQQATVRDIFEFVGVNPDFQPDFSLRYNVTGLPKNRKLQDFLKRPNFFKKMLKPLFSDALRHKIREKIEQKNLVRMPPMTQTQRQHLIDYYADDISALEKILDRDLSAWKQV